MSSSLAVIVCKHEKTGGRKTGLHPGRLRLLARESVVAVSIYEKIGLLFRKPGFSSASASSAAGADRALRGLLRGLLRGGRDRPLRGF